MDSVAYLTIVAATLALMGLAFVGCRFYVVNRPRLASPCLLVALGGLGVLAARPLDLETVRTKAATVSTKQQTVDTKQATVYPLDRVVLPKQQTVNFIAAPTKSVYHRVNGCGHTAWLKSAREFETREEAEQAGFRPCSNCFKEISVSLK